MAANDLIMAIRMVNEDLSRIDEHPVENDLCVFRAGVDFSGGHVAEVKIQMKIRFNDNLIPLPLSAEEYYEMIRNQIYDTLKTYKEYKEYDKQAINGTDDLSTFDAER